MTERKRLFPIFFTVFMDLVGVGIIIPILSVLFMLPEAGLLPASYTLAQRSLLLGLLIASYPAAQFFGAPILGTLSDKYGRKPMLIASLIGTMLGYILFGVGILIHNIPLLFASRILDGFTGGNIAIAMSAIADVSTPQTKAKNFSVVGAAFGLGFILGPFLGGKLADTSLVSWFNYATPLWGAALLTLINIVLVVFFFNETLRKPRQVHVSAFTGFRNIYKAFHKPHLRTIYVVLFLYMLGFTFYTQFFPAFLISKFGVTESQIGNYFAFVGLCVVLTQIFITRRVSSHVASERVIRYTLLGLALLLPLYLVPNVWTGLFYIVPFMAIVQGLTQPNLTATISNLAHEDEQGEILGLSQSVQALAMSVPPIIAGAVFALHRTLPVLLASAFVFCSWLVYFTFYRHHFTKHKND